MKKSEVKVGGRYHTKVSGQMTIVRLLNESRLGGWDALNESSGRKIRIKSAQRLHIEAPLIKWSDTDDGDAPPF